MAVLVDRAITYHSRRGIRWWCDCSFCMAKKRGTWYIGHYHTISPGATSYSNKYPWKYLPPIPAPYEAQQWDRGSAWAIEDFYRRRVHEVREAAREKLRQELNDLKNQVI